MAHNEQQLRVALAPLIADDGSGKPRRTLNRTNWLPISNFRSDFAADNLSLSLDRNLIEFDDDTPQVIQNRLGNGGVATTVIGPPLRNVSIPISCLTSADAAILDRMLRTGRPLSIGAWYDPSTLFMSHLSGIDPIYAGCAEIGRLGNTSTQRRENATTDLTALDWTEHPIAGANAHLGNEAVSTIRRLKYAPGMIGCGARFDNSRHNLAVTRLGVGGGTQILTTSANLADFKESIHGGHPLAAVVNVGSSPVVQNFLLGAETASPRVNYVQTANQSGPIQGSLYTCSLLMRGSGRVTAEWYETGNLGFLGIFDLTDQWEWYSFTFVASNNPTRPIRIYGGSLSPAVSSNVMGQLAAIQIEAGRERTAFMDYNAAPATTKTDCIRFIEPLTAPMFTVVAWVKFVNNDTEKLIFLYEWQESPLRAIHGSIRGNKLWFIDHSSGGPTTAEFTIPSPSSLDGQWIQVAYRWDATGTTVNATARKTAYLNGVSLGTSDCNTWTSVAYAGGISLAEEWFLFGDDAVHHGGGGLALCSVADCIRVDCRAWTDGDVLEDYRMRSDVGMRHILQKVQGRYFAPTLGFDTRGPLIDLIDGTLRLREVGRAVQGAY